MDFSDFDTAVDSAKTGGGVDFDSAVDSVHKSSGMDWSKVGEEGLEPLAPTDVINKGLKMFSQSPVGKISGTGSLAGLVSNMVPSTMNQFAMATAGAPAFNAMLGGAIRSGPGQRVMQWAANKIGLDAPALASMVQNEASGVTKPGPIAAEGSEDLAKMAASNYVDKAAKLQSIIGEPEPDIAIGTKIGGILQKNSQIARQAASAPFDAAAQIAEDATIPMARPKNLAASVREAGLLQDNIPPSLRLGKLGRFLKDESSLNPEAVSNVTGTPANAEGSMFQSVRSLPDLLGIRQELAGLARAGNGAFGTNMPGLAGQSTPSSKFFYDLVDATDKDIATQSAGTGLQSQLAAARLGWKAFKDTYANPFIESLMTKHPSEISKSAFSSPENINALSAAGGEPALSLVRKGVMNDMVNQGSSGLGNTNIRNPNAVLDRLIASKPDEMERLFRPSHLDALRAFAGARQKMIQSLPNVGETSTTAGQKAIAIGSKFLPPQGKIALETLKAMGVPGLGVMAGVPMMKQAAQQNGFSMGQSLPPEQLQMLQKMRQGMQ